MQRPQAPPHAAGSAPHPQPTEATIRVDLIRIDVTAGESPDRRSVARPRFDEAAADRPDGRSGRLP